jgi:hypothetical protein
LSSLTTIWNQAANNRVASVLGSLVVVALGVVLIAVGEVLDWGWTRLIGAGVISIAAVIAGVLIGWSDPLRPGVLKVLASWKRSIVIVLTLIMVAPLFAGLVMLLGGAIVGGTGTDWYLVLSGVLLTLLLLALTVVTVVAAVKLAFDGLTKTQSEGTTSTNGRDSG